MHLFTQIKDVLYTLLNYRAIFTYTLLTPLMTDSGKQLRQHELQCLCWRSSSLCDNFMHEYTVDTCTVPVLPEYCNQLPYVSGYTQPAYPPPATYAPPADLTVHVTETFNPRQVQCNGILCLFKPGENVLDPIHYFSNTL